MRSKIIIDWLTVKFFATTMAEVLEIINIDLFNFESVKPFWGYSSAIGHDGITILQKTDLDIPQNIILNLSGKGCRAYADLTHNSAKKMDPWKVLIDRIRETDSTVTRIDLAQDTDMLSIKTIKKLTEQFIHGNTDHIVTRYEWAQINLSTKGTSCYFGSPTSSTRIRIYDKGAEQGNEPDKITRLEIQLRDDNADFVCKAIGIKELKNVYFGVINNNIRFVKNDNERPTRKTSFPWWRRFLKTDKPLKFDNKGREYSFDKLEEMIRYRYGKTIKTYVKIVGSDGLNRQLDNVRLETKNINLIHQEQRKRLRQ
jgi:DNA relaxase NicK